MLFAFKWYLALLFIALLALPITLRLLRFLPDRGLGFFRQVGLLLAGYAFWLLVSLGILQNTTTNMVFVYLMMGGLALILFLRDREGMMAHLRAHWRDLLGTEVLFLVAFAGFAVFRAYNPDIAATEKPMEFGFMNGILRSRTFPPKDPWLAGYSISYYYFGYVIATMLMRVAAVPSEIGFNLTLTTLFALTVTGVFGLVSNMARSLDVGGAVRKPRLLGPAPGVKGSSPSGGDTVAKSRVQESASPSWGPTLAGLLASLFVALMGNLEGVFELIRARGGGSEALWQWLDVKNLHATPASPTWYPNDGWWWWRASRVIHDRDLAGMSVEVIDEFPFFSYLLGDVHPHVLTLPFVILALALALNLLLSRGRVPAADPGDADPPGLAWLRPMLAIWPGGLLDLALWTVLIGAIGFLNTWDWPIYLGILSLVYAVQRQPRAGHLTWAWALDVVALGLGLLVGGLLCYAPFWVGFRSQAGGIGWVGHFKTRPHQYLLMLGTFIYLVGTFLGVLLNDTLRAAASKRWPLAARIAGGACGVLTVLCLTQWWWTAALVFALIGLAAALLLAGARPDSEGEGGPFLLPRATLFALLLVVAGLALTVSVEFIYLRDTFDSRMNTVFKFYYQAWVLLGIASAYGVYVVGRRLARATAPVKIAGAVWAVVALVLVGSGMSYTVAASMSKAGAFQGEPTLDGTRYVAQYRAEDYDAIQWLRANAPQDAVMVEASGGSYSEYNWVSAHTGIPTLLGWGGHELQWRGSYDIPGQREPDITTIYQSMDVRLIEETLAKHSIDYVYVGRLERTKLNVNPSTLRRFDKIMDRVYQNDGVIIYGYTH